MLFAVKEGKPTVLWKHDISTAMPISMHLNTYSGNVLIPKIAA